MLLTGLKIREKLSSLKFANQHGVKDVQLSMTVIEDRIESNIDTCTMLGYSDADNRNKYLLSFLGRTFGCKVDGTLFRAGRRVFEENMRQAGFRVRNFDNVRETRDQVYHAR